MFVKFLPLFVLISMIANSYGQFCQSDENITRAFIVGENIYFGHNGSFWNFSLVDFKVSDKDQFYIDIFAHSDDRPNAFESIDTAIHFASFPSCPNDIYGDDYCEETGKAKDLVLVIGKIGFHKNQMSGYKAYRRLSNGLMKEFLNKSMPWKLGLDGTFTGDFWVDSETIHSATYDEDKQTIHFITTKSDTIPSLYSKQLLTNGSFPKEFNRSTSLLYDGLFDVNGVLYGLSQNNTINGLIKDSDALKVSKEFSAKEFFNCFNNSTLIALTSTPSGNESSNNSSDVTTGSEPTDESSEETQTTQTTPHSDESKSSAVVIIVVVVIIALILIVILVAVFFLFKSKNTKTSSDVSATSGAEPKTSAPEMPKEPTSELWKGVKSKTDSTENGSKPESTTGSKSMSTKSTTSIQTVRSKTLV